MTFFKFKAGYILIVIFLLALIVRLGFIMGSIGVPSSDASVYDSLGLSISQGGGYINADGTPHSFYPPFYPFFLSMIYRVFGHSHVAVGLVQCVIGAVSCVFIYLMGKKIWGAAVGSIASFVSILYIPFIKSAGLLLTELFFTFILLLAMFYLLKIRDEARFSYFVILGIVLGIGTLTKSVMLAFTVFLIPFFLYMKEKRFLVSLFIVVLTVMPWTIRNYEVYHRFVPLSTQAGITFYSSYKPPDGIFGMLATSPDDPVIREAGRISSPVERNDFLINKTLVFIVKNPKDVLTLELKKILYFWAPFDWEIVGGRWFNFVYVAMLPFFIFGFFISLKGFRKFYPVLLPIVYFQALTLVFYGSPRFRLPVEPYIFLLSAVGILELWRWIYAKTLQGRLQ